MESGNVFFFAKLITRAIYFIYRNIQTHSNGKPYIVCSYLIFIHLHAHEVKWSVVDGVEYLFLKLVIPIMTTLWLIVLAY